MRPIIFLLILLLFLNYESLSLYQYPQIKNGISGNNLSSDDADSYITLAEKYKNKNPDSALYYAKKAVLTFDNSMNEGQIAEMNLLIGHILDKQGNYRVAADYLHSALNIYTTLNNTKKIAEVKNQLGRICADAILIDLSLKHLKDAFALNKSLQNDTIKIQTLYNLGYAYERDNKPQKALFYYKKSEELNNSLQLDEFNFKITEAFASIYEDIGKYDSAMIYYKRVSPMTYSNIYERIDNINNIGDIYRKSGHADSSLLHYTQAYELSVKNHLTRKIEQNARDLALAYEQTGNIKNALFYFKMHINMYKEFYDEQSTAQINQLQIIHESDKLHKEIELHISQTANRTLQRNIVITGFILFLITSLMLWYFLRKQNRVNIRLNSQNDRINRQKEELEEANSELTFLIDQLKNTQDQLVFRKKWQLWVQWQAELLMR
jgi:tetratricopeptide (TPR) repeat protein